MSYIEKKGINGKTHIYFVKKVSFMNKLLVIKKYVSLDSSTFSKEKYILDNLETLSEEELKFKSQFLKQVKKELSYSENLPEKIELKSIKQKILSELN